MFRQLPSRTNNRFLIWVLILIGLTFLPSWSEGALAGVRVCRLDPIVVLSDGRVVRMTAEIAASADDVDIVVYTLHVPTGVEATRVTYTGGALAQKERVDIVDDLGDTNAYVTKTIATTVEQSSV